MASVDVVLAVLDRPRLSLLDALPELPPVPGLYAIYGDQQAWRELGLGPDIGDGRLYVGKAEDNLVTRDLKTHFGDGRTGSSTVRRSFAALLREQLNLRGIPRNVENPKHFDRFALSPENDAKLTRWMRDRLSIAVWPTDGERALSQVEADVLARWHPPINLSKVTHEHRSYLKQQRRVMADQARAWTPNA
jgi:hypothetical protein